MTRVLAVGDPHATPDELDDCDGLCRLVADVAVEQNVDAIVFMGDLHHTHAMVRVEVTAFWLNWLEALGSFRPTYVILGNHDYPHGAPRGEDGRAAPEAHALQSYRHIPGVTVVDGIVQTDFGLLVPYLQDPEVLAGIPAHQPPVVYCHQDFLGARYENGWAPQDAFDPARRPDVQFKVGHVHLAQSYANVQFVGAPRWRTLSDAGIDRHIYVFDENGAELKRFPTDPACSRIEHLIVREEPAPVSYPPGTRLRVDLCGTAAENERWAAAFPGARIRRFDKVSVGPRVRESRGVDQAFRDYLAGTKMETPPQRLAELAAGLLGIHA